MKEPIHQRDIPDGPLHKVGTYLFINAGRDYLIVIDYFSKYAEVDNDHSNREPSVVEAIKIVIAHHGIPQAVVTDNMLYNSYEFRDFAILCNFQLTISSPSYPKSYDEAEKHVGIVKMMLRKCKGDGRDPDLALLRYRNMPIKRYTDSS